MYKAIRKVLIMAFVAAQLQGHAQFPGLAKTPPMGWNSWNAFGLEINSTIVKAVADSMVSKGMAKAGYQYIVIDDGWQIARDNKGKIIVDSTRFPEGMKYLADYVHSRGLKFGIYTCCGTKTCGGRPGSYGHEEIDARTYAEWGVDFIKEDWCFTDGLDTKVQYKKMSDAIKATGRPMLLSLCEWGVSAPWEWANGVGAMWRTTNDIQDCFDCVRNWGGMGWVPILQKNAELAPYAGPGGWNDPDMLEVGNKSLNATECRAHFSMWCMLAAPLIAGNNISTMNDTVKAILTAPEIIAVDQDELGIQGTRIKNDNGLQVWQKPLNDGSVAVALLNLTRSAATIGVAMEDIGFDNNSAATVRDLWEQKNLSPATGKFSAGVPAHGVVMVKIKGTRSSNAMIAFTEPAFILNQGNHKLLQLSVKPAGLSVKLSSSNTNVAGISIAGVNTYRIAGNKTGTAVIKASSLDGKLTRTVKVQVVPSNLPAPWKMSDIKNDKASASFSKGVFSIEGSGADIWNTADQFAFVHQPATGDNFITARIISQTNTDPWAKTGLMIRESVAPNSAFVMICVTPGNGLSLQWRDSTNAKAAGKDFKAEPLPVYLKLVKAGARFTAYSSADGINWKELGNVSLPAFAGKHLAGMAVTSHATQLINYSQFSRLTTGKLK